MRNLVVVLGDQLDRHSAALDGFDPAQDAIWMAEVAEESTHVWSHRVRIALFLSAMRHFCAEQRQLGRTVWYQSLDAAENTQTLAGELERSIREHRPQRIVWVEAGDYRVRESLTAVVQAANVPLDVRPDRHFFCSTEDFRKHAAGKKSLRLEFFYREMRRKTGILMDGKEPAGGAWNFDVENRGSFGKDGPKRVPQPARFPPDAITQAVLELVARRFPAHPGSLAAFDWPVTPAEAEAALEDFITHRLSQFGEYQDAMWTNQPLLYHSRLSAAMNLKYLHPKKVCDAAERAYRTGVAPLPAVEGFIRQILGWREYVRGIYWQYMPEYAERNALDAHQPLPKWYWTGETDYHCLRQAIRQTLDFGYAHHIQRLMVTGLFSLLLGVRPQEIHEWYLAVYVDAIEWVELPNVLGMSQFADGGTMASKPYAATGKYIQRMSNYCAGCRYDPTESVGSTACPFTTLYWDFIDRHQLMLSKNQRMVMQVRNLERMSADSRAAIRRQAAQLRESLE
ncbi:cryptochrome/photolyase family protein [Tuwongella immobilis]|uniref:Cryptochrome/photolyase family protein n=1 Tax=Tuwongella immobilis TaxID=692036 RepID=A0A6C2YVC9_9BACT|nr:cryptochrome/photolyase family protein [Tuwongella immobilis]VIP04865.1 deoxyribodipyrimidine photolyase : Putative Deoxyribodipyrimidine photolyase-related protein OS=Thiomonas sp. CB2 GN=THICB2_570023 PE=4 SV=1: DPRP: FAD_binding_7 [Tuwongella immobilis]VTS07089.1 deoxyribodipyrimidine photolyase : Putative Deoxyribodipyrimidine photolyase-related protein OS=Thiomonas sp. CB2 GN=THICB2_570023 PE=4 SV=1: DPRP: FAD_binding_7 [Tuwongella immobilis]